MILCISGSVYLLSDTFVCLSRSICSWSRLRVSTFESPSFHPSWPRFQWQPVAPLHALVFFDLVWRGARRSRANSLVNINFYSHSLSHTGYCILTLSVTSFEVMFNSRPTHASSTRLMVWVRQLQFIGSRFTSGKTALASLININKQLAWVCCAWRVANDLQYFSKYKQSIKLTR